MANGLPPLEVSKVPTDIPPMWDYSTGGVWNSASTAYCQTHLFRRIFADNMYLMASIALGLSTGGVWNSAGIAFCQTHLLRRIFADNMYLRASIALGLFTGGVWNSAGTAFCQTHLLRRIFSNMYLRASIALGLSTGVYEIQLAQHIAKLTCLEESLPTTCTWGHL